MLELAALPQTRHPTAATTSASSDGGTDAGRARPVRILIVEDDYFVATDLEHKLTEAGFEVVGVAVTAEEAIQLAAEAKPALAVMDIRLAGKRDGIDAAVELLGKHQVRSIFATAHCDAETRVRAQKAQPLGWLTKPYSAELVLATIREVLRGS